MKNFSKEDIEDVMPFINLQKESLVLFLYIMAYFGISVNQVCIKMKTDPRTFDRFCSGFVDITTITRVASAIRSILKARDTERNLKRTKSETVSDDLEKFKKLYNSFHKIWEPREDDAILDGYGVLCRYGHAEKTIREIYKHIAGNKNLTIDKDAILQNGKESARKELSRITNTTFLTK